MSIFDWALMTPEERYEEGLTLLPVILDDVPESSEVSELLGLWLAHAAVRGAARKWNPEGSSMGFAELATMWTAEKIRDSISEGVFVTPAERVSAMVYTDDVDGGAL